MEMTFLSMSKLIVFIAIFSVSLAIPGGHGDGFGGGHSGGFSAGHGGGDDGGLGGHGAAEVAGGGEEHGHYVDYHSHPKYEFAYGVKDGHTGDHKSHWEHRDGDHVKGGYTVHEADGTLRIVEYSADKHNGFNAVVKRVGHGQHSAVYGHADSGHGDSGHGDGEAGDGGHGHGGSSYSNINLHNHHH